MISRRKTIRKLPRIRIPVITRADRNSVSLTRNLDFGFTAGQTPKYDTEYPLRKLARRIRQNLKRRKR